MIADKLKIGDIFKDIEGDYCKVYDVGSGKVWINYDKNLNNLKKSNYRDSTYYDKSHLYEMEVDGNLTLIESKINWRKRLEK